MRSRRIILGIRWHDFINMLARVNTNKTYVHLNLAQLQQIPYSRYCTVFGYSHRPPGDKVPPYVCALRRESHVCVVVVTVNDFLASVACSVTFH